MTPSERIKALRKRMHLTQEAVAERSCRLSRTDIVRIENGYLKASSSAARKALATAFGFEATTPFDRYLDGEIELDALIASSRVVVVTAPKDPSPARAAAVIFAIANGLPSDAIKRVQAMTTRQYTPEEWYNRMKLEASEIRLREDHASPATPRSATRSKAG